MPEWVLMVLTVGIIAVVFGVTRHIHATEIARLDASHRETMERAASEIQYLRERGSTQERMLTEALSPGLPRRADPVQYTAPSVTQVEPTGTDEGVEMPPLC